MTVNTLAVCNESVVAVSDDLKQRKVKVVIRVRTEKMCVKQHTTACHMVLVLIMRPRLMLA